MLKNAQGGSWIMQCTQRHPSFSVVPLRCCFGKYTLRYPLLLFVTVLLLSDRTAFLASGAIPILCGGSSVTITSFGSFNYNCSLPAAIIVQPSSSYGSVAIQTLRPVLSVTFIGVSGGYNAALTISGATPISTIAAPALVQLSTASTNTITNFSLVLDCPVTFRSVLTSIARFHAVPTMLLEINTTVNGIIDVADARSMFFFLVSPSANTLSVNLFGKVSMVRNDTTVFDSALFEVASDATMSGVSIRIRSPSLTFRGIGQTSHSNLITAGRLLDIDMSIIVDGNISLMSSLWLVAAAGSIERATVTMVTLSWLTIVSSSLVSAATSIMSSSLTITASSAMNITNSKIAVSTSIMSTALVDMAVTSGRLDIVNSDVLSAGCAAAGISLKIRSMSGPLYVEGTGGNFLAASDQASSVNFNPIVGAVVELRGDSITLLNVLCLTSYYSVKSAGISLFASISFILLESTFIGVSSSATVQSFSLIANATTTLDSSGCSLGVAQGPADTVSVALIGGGNITIQLCDVGRSLTSQALSLNTTIMSSNGSLSIYKGFFMLGTHVVSTAQLVANSQGSMLWRDAKVMQSVSAGGVSFCGITLSSLEGGIHIVGSSASIPSYWVKAADGAGSIVGISLTIVAKAFLLLKMVNMVTGGLAIRQSSIVLTVQNALSIFSSNVLQGSGGTSQLFDTNLTAYTPDAMVLSDSALMLTTFSIVSCRLRLFTGSWDAQRSLIMTARSSSIQGSYFSLNASLKVLISNISVQGSSSGSTNCGSDFDIGGLIVAEVMSVMTSSSVISNCYVRIVASGSVEVSSSTLLYALWPMSASAVSLKSLTDGVTISGGGPTTRSMIGTSVATDPGNPNTIVLHTVRIVAANDIRVTNAQFASAFWSLSSISATMTSSSGGVYLENVFLGVSSSTVLSTMSFNLTARLNVSLVKVAIGVASEFVSLSVSVVGGLIRITDSVLSAATVRAGQQFDVALAALNDVTVLNSSVGTATTTLAASSIRISSTTGSLVISNVTLMSSQTSTLTSSYVRMNATAGTVYIADSIVMNSTLSMVTVSVTIAANNWTMRRSRLMFCSAALAKGTIEVSGLQTLDTTDLSFAALITALNITMYCCSFSLPSSPFRMLSASVGQLSLVVKDCTIATTVGDLTTLVTVTSLSNAMINLSGRNVLQITGTAQRGAAPWLLNSSQTIGMLNLLVEGLAIVAMSLKLKANTAPKMAFALPLDAPGTYRIALVNCSVTNFVANSSGSRRELTFNDIAYMPPVVNFVLDVVPPLDRCDDPLHKSPSLSHTLPSQFVTTGSGSLSTPGSTSITTVQSSSLSTSTNKSQPSTSPSYPLSLSRSSTMSLSRQSFTVSRTRNWSQDLTRHVKRRSTLSSTSAIWSSSGTHLKSAARPVSTVPGGTSTSPSDQTISMSRSSAGAKNASSEPFIQQRCDDLVLVPLSLAPKSTDSSAFSLDVTPQSSGGRLDGWIPFDATQLEIHAIRLAVKFPQVVDETVTLVTVSVSKPTEWNSTTTAGSTIVVTLLLAGNNSSAGRWADAFQISSSAPYAQQSFSVILGYRCTAAAGSVVSTAVVVVRIAPRALPQSVNAAQQTTTSAMAMSIVSTTTPGGVASRVNALLKLLKCSSAKAASDESRSDTGDGGVLGMSVGSDDYALYRGAIAGNMIVVAVATTVSLIVSAIVAYASRISITESLARLHFPSLVLPAFAVTLESSVESILTVFFAGLDAPTTALAAVGAVLVVGAVGAVALGVLRSHQLLVCIPKGKNDFSDEEGAVDDGGTQGGESVRKAGALPFWSRVEAQCPAAGGILASLFRARWKWKPKQPSNRAATRIFATCFVLLDEVHVGWFPALDMSLSLFCGVVCSIPQPYWSSCKVPVALVLSAMAFQCVVVVALRPFASVFVNVFSLLMMTTSVVSVSSQFFLSESNQDSAVYRYVVTISAATAMCVVAMSIMKSLLDIVSLAVSLRRLLQFIRNKRRSSRRPPSLFVAEAGDRDEPCDAPPATGSGTESSSPPLVWSSRRKRAAATRHSRPSEPPNLSTAFAALDESDEEDDELDPIAAFSGRRGDTDALQLQEGSDDWLRHNSVFERLWSEAASQSPSTAQRAERPDAPFDMLSSDGELSNGSKDWRDIVSSPASTKYNPLMSL